MPTNAPNGLGGSVAEELLLAKPLTYSGEAWYVDSQTGSASFSGKDRKMPFASISSALTAIGVNQDHIIVCLSGHTENAEGLTISRRMTIVGEGLSNNAPTVTFSMGFTLDLFTVTSPNVKFRNIKFNTQTGGSSGKAYVESAQEHITFLGCHFLMSERTLGAGVSQLAGANFWRYDSCRFEQVSTQSPVVDRSRPGVLIGGAVTGLDMNHCVFDGGVNGFQTVSGEPYAFDAQGIITNLDVLNMSLLRGADFSLLTGTTGHVNAAITTGSSRVVWP